MMAALPRPMRVLVVSSMMQCCLLVDLLDTLLELPAEATNTAAAACSWRVLLTLAVETGDDRSLPRITSNLYLASLRRSMGLPSALRHELKRLSSQAKIKPIDQAKPSRPLALVWKLSLTAAGLPQASAPTSQGK